MTSCNSASVSIKVAEALTVLLMTLASLTVVLLPVTAGDDMYSLDHAPEEMLIATASNTTSPILRSSDGSYTWQFAPYQNNQTRLLVVLSTAFNTTIIWIANRNHPVSPHASLLQMPSRSLVLRDVDGSTAWSSPVADIHDVLINSTGNLIMRDAHNATIWQSFDDASDVLVPGQVVRTNHSVVSRISLENVSEGHYTLKVEPGGAVLYASFDWQQNKVPYALVLYAAQGGSAVYFGTNLDQALESACNHTILLYKEEGTGVALQQEGSIITPQCRAEVGNGADDAHGIDFGTRLGNPGFRFLRLMPYGDIATFVSDATGVALDNEFFGGMLNTYCKLPSFCGVNSLCSLRDNCTCPSMFEPIDPSNMRLGCRLMDALDCSIYSQHQFWSLTGVDYYANNYLPPHHVTSPEECQGLCRANCSCTAAFYRNTSRECYLYDQVQTMQPGADAASITAYLRVAKLPITDLPTSRSIPKKAIIGATISVAVVLVSLLILLVWIGRRVMNKPDDESDLEEEAFLESLPGLPPRFTYKDLHSATEGFSKKLGAGGSGAVYEGCVLPADAHRNNKLKDGAQEALTKVAVKELRQVSQLATIAASGKKQFRAEVATLGSLSHVNLVQLRGFCAEGPHRLLVYEFLENGSLDRWIFHRENIADGSTASTLTWEVRYRIAIDTARGLAFLHEGSRDKVVHLDVKPQNILLDENFRAKLADFGLCKLVDREAATRGEGAGQSQTVTAMRGTPGYMAPEWFLNLPVTDRSDVFSYGMVLLELVGGRKNLNLAAGSEDEWYFPAWAVGQAENGRLLDVVDRGLMSSVPEAEQSASSAMCVAMARLLHVAFWCIQENAGSRPSMSTVLLMLEEHLQVPEPPLDRTYILRRQSRPIPIFNNASTSTTTTRSSNSMQSCAPISGIISELEPR